MKSWIRGLGLVLSSILTAYHSADAQPSGETMNPVTAPSGSSDNLDEIVVHGIRRGDLIMPTTVLSNSAYGLDLGVMDTPRNNTVLSKAQLDALDVQNPGGFSSLTSSAYSDASFGEPNIPRIRGQYADMFYNGMRDSFTLNGYGAPISFNQVDSIDIIKGPASVQGGAGPGVGGSIDIATKMPSMTTFATTASIEADTHQKRILSLDLGGPLIENVAGRVSFTSNDSGSYYYDMYFHQQSLYAALVADVTSNYKISINGDITDSRYRENDGINRLNQGLIDNSTYLTGAPSLSNVTGFGTEVDLTGSTVLNPRTIIDEPAGTGAHALHAMLQVIQTLTLSDDFSIVNNTFYDYVNRYNQTEDYYADTAKGSYTFENKTDFKVKFPLGPVHNEIDAGFTYRYAHVLDIQNYNNEPVSVFDLSKSPNTWVFPNSAQLIGGAFPYSGAFGHTQYGFPGEGTAFGTILYPNATIDSNLQDAAIFLEHRLTFSPQWSVLYGLRGDLVQLNDSDPLYSAAAAPYASPGNVDGYTVTPPESQHTGWYGLYNGNISLVYSPTDWMSTYLTYNKAQYVYAEANDGAVGALNVAPVTQLRQGTLLEEAGVKFDLLGKALFISIAGFKQEREESTGPSIYDESYAHITGAEFELNYQPNAHLFATASYSYLHTRLDTPATFYNFPAQPGFNIDGAGTALGCISGSCGFRPNQNFEDPGVPTHLINFLVNYKLDSGLGFQANLQVTGPVQTTQAGYVNIAALESNLNSDFGFGSYSEPINNAIPASVLKTGYYNPPTIPWQYTLNAGVFYSFLQHYTARLMVYNLADRVNWLNDNPFYGNDFLTRQPPRSFDLTLTGKF
ncbi:MAG: TonB-dependent receptor [Steroidobacteraceae bacterium]|jgi:outer membrane receptor protein involved in Fe transport